MITQVVATLIIARDAILQTLPANLPEILSQIPHPVPGYYDFGLGRWVDAADWSIPEDTKVLSTAIMDPKYNPPKSSSFNSSIASLDVEFPGIKTAIVSIKNVYDPVIGELRGDENSGGASTAKIAGLISLYQLLYEMSKLAKEKSITTVNDLQNEANTIWQNRGFVQNGAKTRLPNLKKLFEFYDFSKTTVKIHDARSITSKDIGIVDYFTHFDAVSRTPKLFFKKSILEILWPKGGPHGTDAVGFSHGNVGGLLIKHIGFAYVGSVMLQSGLFKRDGGDSGNGIWLRSDYYKGGNWAKRENPFPKLPSIQNITAKSVADFFTLLMQKRIVNQRVSDEIKNILHEGGCISLFNHSDFDIVLASKCGFVKQINNDAIVTDDLALFKYILVVLTDNDSISANIISKKDDFLTQVNNLLRPFV